MYIYIWEDEIYTRNNVVERTQKLCVYTSDVVRITNDISAEYSSSCFFFLYCMCVWLSSYIYECEAIIFFRHGGKMTESTELPLELTDHSYLSLLFLVFLLWCFSLFHSYSYSFNHLAEAFFFYSISIYSDRIFYTKHKWTKTTIHWIW